MRETFTYGTVGGALGNRRFYPEVNHSILIPPYLVSEAYPIDLKQTAQILNSYFFFSIYDSLSIAMLGVVLICKAIVD